MTSIFFQAIGKPKQAILTSLIRDVLCFTPLAVILPAILEASKEGSGINGILYAAPISDIIAFVVILCVTVPFLREINSKDIIRNERLE